MSDAPSFSDDDRPAIAPPFRFQWEEAQQAYVLLYPEGMVTLNDSAGEILRRCDGTRTVTTLLQELRSDFPDADLGADVRGFLEEAYEHGWIRAADA
ncbi:MAG: pyrroloquinoline quinone biosynthesis peptide chaperone PqqD [Gammaproteobacteria bacterium]|nr:pyrroloquinoline quinone biosynthesis peptide chaperone PqqD [Gammaproteobacteria bacterium]